MFGRSARWWQHRALSDPEFARNGATAHRRVLHVREGVPVGYMLYRTRTNSDRHPNEAIVIELLGIDSEAERALWQYLFGLDLITSFEYWNQPVDSPLHWWLVQSRRLERQVFDGLWIRLVDVATALRSRTYSQSGTLLIEVQDEVCPWNAGTHRLDVQEDGHPECGRTERAAEIKVSSYALGALYLGGHRFQDLARAGIIEGSSAALRRADAMFTSARMPWCQEIF